MRIFYLLSILLLAIGCTRNAPVALQPQGTWQCTDMRLADESYRSVALSLDQVRLVFGAEADFELIAGDIVVASGTYSTTAGLLSMRTEQAYMRVRMEDDCHLTFYRYIPGHGNYELRFERQ